MSHTIKEENKDKAPKPVKPPAPIRGHRPNKQKLSRDEIVKLLSEQGFG